MTILRSAARSISILGISQLVMWLVALAFTIAQARLLGPARFGVFSVALSYAAFVGIVIDFGLGTQLSRMVAQRREGHAEALAATMLLRAGLWLAALPLLAVATLVFGYDAELRDAIFILALSMLLVGFGTAIASYLQGREQFLLASVAQVAQRLVSAGVGIAVLVVRPDLTALAWAFVLGGVANVVVLLFGLRRGFEPSRWIDGAVAVRFFRSTIPLGLFSIATTFYWGVDMIMLERLAPAENVGWYAAAYRLFSVATIPATLIGSVALYPVLARLAVSSRQELRAVIEKSFTLLILAGTAAALVLLLFADPIVALLYPAASYAAAANSLRLLAPALLFIHVNWIFASSLLGLHQERRLLVIAVAAAALNPLANLIAIPLLRQDGAALVTSLTELFLLVSLLRTMPRDLLGSESLRVAAKALLAAAITAALILPVSGVTLFVTVPLTLACFGMFTFALQAVSKSDLSALRALIQPAEVRS